MTTAQLVAVRCANTWCPERRRRGYALVIGEVERGATWRIKCPRCKAFATGRA